MANSGNPKVTKYPKNINNINIGMVFFAVMAIYIIISVITYFRRDHIVGYEVMEGALSTNNIYDAVAIRQEKIIESDTVVFCDRVMKDRSHVELLAIGVSLGDIRRCAGSLVVRVICYDI